MTWVRIDENFAQHPKVAKAGPLGIALHVAALCYCNRHLTDGFVPKQIACTLLDFSGLGMRMWDGEMVGGGRDAEWSMVVDDLVDAGLWRPTEGGWFIHDYLDYQPSKQQVQRLKEVRSKTGRRGGQASAEQRSTKVEANSQAKPQAKINPVPVSDTNIKKEKEDARPEPRGDVLPPELIPDPRKAIFDDGLRWLASVTRRPERALRPMLGKWIKARGDPEVAASLVAAQQAGIVDPIAWIEARLKANGKQKPSDLQRRRALAEEFLGLDVGEPETGGPPSDQAPAGEALSGVPDGPSR